ncbi:peptidoglycan-binding domain-containing protein [Priestia aryabhattai]|uniref:peptidoglycan-binding domain-containing protein n=1 Tax=Priestia TaxID=2800373 RepID=UPI001E48BE96|nr:peptidoglycan-binding protein [Priestia megaterium]MCE4093210.1 peptidoglycan-binding protein [Priestia megaterium]
MRKLLSSLFACSMLLGASLPLSVSAEGTEDAPSAETDYVDVLDPAPEADSLGREYARSFSCDAGSAASGTPLTEKGSYDWIKANGTKGYVQDGQRGGTTLGVVLNNITIDFSYKYVVKLSYSGNNPSQVKAVQSTLKCLGYDPGSVDGVFGPSTDSAVKAFQRRRGLPADGVVGKKTYHVLSYAAY